METPQPGGGAAPGDPEEVEATATATTTQLPDDTRLGPVQLTVADVERSIAYYRDSIGLQPLVNGHDRVTLGTGDRPLLELVEQPGAAPSDGYTGLYHFALLVPERRDLAGWLAHAARDDVPLTGLSDHFVSEAIYLRDPDRHGIEIYCDRPRSIWEGQVGQRMTTQPLDVDDLLGELEDPAASSFDGLPAGTVMGHVHLKVADIPATVGFYRDVVGFGLIAQLGGQAAFLAAGGYHHHLGANTWESAGAQPPPAGLAALRRYTVVLPGQPARDALAARLEQGGAVMEHQGEGPVVTDPSGNSVLLAAG